VLKTNTLRCLLFLAATQGLEIQQLDIRTAFLYGELDEEIYRYPPESTNYGPNIILTLKKSLCDEAGTKSFS
jgi:hypothetical protein